MSWIWNLPISDRVALRHTTQMRVEHIRMTLNPTIFECERMERNKQISDPEETSETKFTSTKYSSR